MSEKTPALWSDFDGTAVEKLSAKNPWHWRRNMFKYPLAPIPGYVEFIGGVQEAGVDFAGAVTIRKERVRRSATERTIRDHGYDVVLPPERVVYGGNEAGKAQFVADESAKMPLGMIDDKPHKFGKALMQALVESDEAHHPIVLGAVSTPKTPDYINELATTLKDTYGTGIKINALGSLIQPELVVVTDNFDLHVLQLPEYSGQAGVDFGNDIVAFAA